jgi:alkyl hydroperoxide reductase subunit F
MYDVIIIGGGPAGFAAAIYAARREMKTLLITKHPGGQMIWASLIENYPGFKSIGAQELIEKMEEQVRALGVEIQIGEVQEIKKMADENFEVALGEQKISGKTVIACLGAAHRRLNIPGEKELEGRGVAFCANCDGPLFRNKTVAVIGGGNSALDAAEVLSKIASKVYLIHQFKDFQAFEKLEEKVRGISNVEIILENKVEAIKGDKKVAGISIRPSEGGEAREIALDGIFIEIGFVVNTGLVSDLVKLNENKEIIISPKGETSLPGLFAAGDCADTAFKQISIATGSGTLAALGAYQYIQLKEGNLGKLLK